MSARELYRTETFVSTTQEAQSIIQRLDNAATQLCDAIAANGDAQTKLREAKEVMGSAEAQVIFAHNMRDGFKGIATTSKMYAYAIEALVSDEKAPSGKLSLEAQDLNKALRTADLAATQLAQAQTLYGALKHIADLKGHILAAGG